MQEVKQNPSMLLVILLDRSSYIISNQYHIRCAMHAFKKEDPCDKLVESNKKWKSTDL